MILNIHKISELSPISHKLKSEAQGFDFRSEIGVGDSPVLDAMDASRFAVPRRMFEHRWQNGTIPVVSIICFAYNHEKFIEQCIEGFLMQETTFPVEIIIHDDASQDRTADIIRSYDAKHPGVFRLVLQTENQMKVGKNPSGLYNNARGDYIAICEGDDYWTSPHKLQLQVELLDSHPEMALCHTLTEKVRTEHGTTSTTEMLPPAEFRRQAHAGDLIATNFISTPSVSFRRDRLPKLDKRFLTLKISDWPLWYLLAERGTIGFIDSCTAAYRIHGANTFAGQPWETRVAQTAEAFFFMASQASKARSSQLLRQAERFAMDAASGQTGFVKPAEVFWQLFQQRLTTRFSWVWFLVLLSFVYWRILRGKLRLRSRFKTAFSRRD